MHGLGLVHRDVKPSNVLLTLDGPRLIDFGIARAIDGTASLTSTGVSVGSPGYMAPEQIRGQGISGAADVFSLGAVLAYAATGARPFPGDSSAVLLYKVVHEEPELGELEGELREVIAACLAKDPARRPTPSELARRLAPDGAAALVAAGWLPGTLVREVSRAAVALLDLEPQDAPVQSGPVPFSNAFLDGQADGTPGGNEAQAGGRTGGALGVFGPPIEPAFPPRAHQPAGSAGDNSTGLPGPRTPEPRFSLTVGADSGPARPDRNRGRRLSCTVALAVAGALAAVTVGSAFLFDLLPGSGGGDAGGHDGVAQPAPTTSAIPAVDPDGRTGGADQVAALPKAFVGTWKGPLTEKTTGQPHGTLTAVFTEGEKGTDVVRMNTTVSTLGVTVSCNSIARLSSGTAKELTLRERTDPDRPSTAGLCTSTTTDVVFTLAGDGTLRFRSEERGAGLPYGTLSRSGR